MDLLAFSIENYRRFVDRTSVKLHNDLVAFVGPNEAGKSSLLDALVHLNHDEAFTRTELPRRSQGAEPNLTWELQLNVDDKAAIAELHGADAVERITVKKTGTNRRRVIFHPAAPFRDPTVRLTTAAAVRRDQAVFGRLVALEAIDLDLIGELTRSLEEGKAPSEEEVALLASFGTWLGTGVSRIESDELDIADIESDLELKWPDRLRELIDALNALVAHESAPDPSHTAASILLGRLPEMLLMGSDDRDLQSSYDVESQADNPAPALAHLARLAELDLVALRQEIRDSNIADITTRRNNANKRLSDVFDESWNQEGVAVQLEVQGAVIHVQMSTPRDNGVSSLDERSDGLRWFAALLAFTHGGRGHPILLADEIETHLHYDAQADLVDVLARQAYTSKVLYTTHSFGCLPNDLGNGVRVVEQLDVGASRLRNGFWESGAGFSPLLKSMGAAAASFTPARYALIGEGPTEAIALPTLFRQVSGSRRLDFQVAPGLASVAASTVPLLSGEAGHVAFVVDGDPGGLRNRKVLVQNGVEEERIVTLVSQSGEPLEIEDFFDAEIYARCVDDEIHCWGDLAAHFEAKDLSSTMRTKSVQSWCAKRSLAAPDKVAVAQRVINASATNQVFEASRADLLRSLLKSVESALGLPVPEK